MKRKMGDESMMGGRGKKGTIVYILPMTEKLRPAEGHRDIMGWVLSFFCYYLRFPVRGLSPWS